MLNWDDVRHFGPQEWGKDPDLVDERLVLTMDEVRAQAGVPVIVHVAWDDGGHSGNSQHYDGKAVDFHFGRGLSLVEEFALLSSFRAFGGIGFYPDWRPRPGWHVDIRDNAQALLWVRLGDQYHYGASAMARALNAYGMETGL